MSLPSTGLRVFLIAALLSGCGAMPRGAAFQNEVIDVALKAEARGEEAPFQVFAIQEATLPQLSNWPAGAGLNGNWPKRADNPPTILIAPGDQLEVTIWDSSENSLLLTRGERSSRLQTLTVSAAGRVDLPYVGSIRVQGMSPERARATIEEQFAEVVPGGQVQVLHQPGRGNKVSLVGGVRTPGTYPMSDQSFSVLQLLSDGGGVREDLRNPQVRLMRGGSMYRISVDSLYASPANDAALRPGDRVIVAEDDRYFLSLGAAGAEAQHAFTRPDVSALDAMAIVGGVNDFRADPKGILILREYPAKAVRRDGRGPTHKRVVFTLDLTSADGLFSARHFHIQTGDLVYVTENPIAGARSVLSLVRSSVALSNALGVE